MKQTLAIAFTTAALVAAGTGPAQAGDAHVSPRIIYGANRDATFDFSDQPQIRRSDASTRQAYFGSGEEYSRTLEHLQERLQAIVARDHLNAISLTPAQEAAKDGMSPALMRALALSRQARDDTAAD